MAVKIIACKCQHEFQDKQYGKGMRVHNEAKSKIASSPAYRCTVCGDKKG